MTLRDLATRTFVLARNIKNFSLTAQHRDESGQLVSEIHDYLAPKRETRGALDENVLHAERQLIQAHSEIKQAYEAGQPVTQETVTKISTAAKHLRIASND